MHATAQEERSNRSEEEGESDIVRMKFADGRHIVLVGTNHLQSRGSELVVQVNLREGGKTKTTYQTSSFVGYTITKMLDAVKPNCVMVRPPSYLLPIENKKLNNDRSSWIDQKPKRVVRRPSPPKRGSLVD